VQRDQAADVPRGSAKRLQQHTAAARSNPQDVLCGGAQYGDGARRDRPGPGRTACPPCSGQRNMDGSGCRSGCADRAGALSSQEWPDVVAAGATSRSATAGACAAAWLCVCLRCLGLQKLTGSTCAALGRCAWCGCAESANRGGRVKCATRACAVVQRESVLDFRIRAANAPELKLREHCPARPALPAPVDARQQWAPPAETLRAIPLLYSCAAHSQNLPESACLAARAPRPVEAPPTPGTCATDPRRAGEPATPPARAAKKTQKARPSEDTNVRPARRRQPRINLAGCRQGGKHAAGENFGYLILSCAG
jgi:hypothetical protein